MKHGPELSFDDDGRPILITRAAPSYEVQHRQRVRKYLALMFWRIPALILAAVAYGIWENGLISLAILVASIPLPWIAVLIANDRPPRRAEEPRRLRVQTANSTVPDGRTTRAGISRALGAAIWRRRAAPRCRGLRIFFRNSQHILRSTANNRRSERVNRPMLGNSWGRQSVIALDSSTRSGGRHGKCHP